MNDKCFHIIVADDDDDDQFIIKEAISEYHEKNITVTSVYDGLQLLDYMQRKGSVAANYRRPDLILLDINMPLLSGIEALQAIKTNSSLRDIPVCMISTSRTEEQQKKCLDLGATGFYTKPNRIGAYRTILDELFAKTIYQEV